MKKCKIVMTAMFKNESSVVKRMLESCYKHIDFWVVQDNGSTDGTDKIVKEFFEEKKIPGYYYQVEEGWVGFGWNRDHLTRTCQSINHGCDWILKMDCDEVLEVDDDFDWSLLDDKTQHSFHIPAVQNNCVYYRAWMWNAKMPWRFNHDPCHETSYCEIDGIGENFNRFNLPLSFRQIGSTGGQSWSVPTKFISDALILEEKLIKENSMLTDMYHFWYIGKSYNDSYHSNAFPLGDSQKREYARRTIYYFQEYLNHTHNFANTKKALCIDETAYMTLLLMGDANWFLSQRDESIECYQLAEQFAPERNDHLYILAEKYKYMDNFDKMLEYTTIMMQPERVNPFPKYMNFIDKTLYHDGGDRVMNLHREATRLVMQKNNTVIMPLQINSFNINQKFNKRMFIVDNFYENPDSIRQHALTMEFKEDLRYYKGVRTTTHFHPSGIKEAFESIMGQKLTSFDGGINGCFQITTAKDPQVYHYDNQTWAAMIYLTPNAPIESGTRLHRSKINGARHSSESHIDVAFTGGFLDSTKFDTVDSAANIYNRLVIMDARCIHSAGQYFGQNLNDGRLVHLFFFD
jgi:glycosyltransferase involved in cell wall biosynthesis